MDNNNNNNNNLPLHSQFHLFFKKKTNLLRFSKQRRRIKHVSSSNVDANVGSYQPKIFNPPHRVVHFNLRERKA